MSASEGSVNVKELEVNLVALVVSMTQQLLNCKKSQESPKKHFDEKRMLTFSMKIEIMLSNIQELTMLELAG